MAPSELSNNLLIRLNNIKNSTKFKANFVESCRFHAALQKIFGHDQKTTT